MLMISVQNLSKRYGELRAVDRISFTAAKGELFGLLGPNGAGKTTLVRNLFRKLEAKNILAAQLVSTHLGSEDTLRMAAAAFGLPFKDASKADLLTGLEEFLRLCDRQGKRALLVVDEAQNLAPRAVEELRMLSNFQTADKSLLQTFLLGQPEFRKTLNGSEMEQLRQRVIATYHLGPMDASETRSYIEHRLNTVGWRGDPSFGEDAFAAVYDYTTGIPRKINTLCDRLLLMGCLEELHDFGSSEVNEVIRDIQHEFDLPASGADAQTTSTTVPGKEETRVSLENMDERLAKMESSVISVLDLLKQILSLPRVNKELSKRR